MISQFELHLRHIYQFEDPVRQMSVQIWQIVTDDVESVQGMSTHLGCINRLCICNESIVWSGWSTSIWILCRQQCCLIIATHSACFNHWFKKITQSCWWNGIVVSFPNNMLFWNFCRIAALMLKIQICQFDEPPAHISQFNVKKSIVLN